MAKFVVVGLCLLMVATFGQAVLAVTEAPQVEQSTESPIADMALIEEAPMAPKTPTEKPPVVQDSSAAEAQEKAAPAASVVPVVPVAPAASQQPHTVADFIIHPLIAFKPRQASLEEIQGKQAPAAPGSSAPASPGTWLFGMNPAQQLGSSFSTLAGSVSGWFNDRLAAAGQQLPGLVETPVRESSSSTSSTTSTTTQRPDIVVRLQQRPQRNGNRNGNGNANRNGNGNGNGNGFANGNGNRNGNGNGGNLNNNRRRQRPNRFNNRLDSFEDDYYEDDYFQGNRFDEEFDDDEDEQSLEQFEDEDSLELRPQQKPKRKQTQAQAQSQRRKFPQEEEQVVSQKRRQSATHSKKPLAQKRPAHPAPEDSQDEEEQEDDQENDDDEEEEPQEDDSQEQDFQPEPLFASTSTRRSQNQPNFIQRGQQSIISQIRQFTRGQTPGELATTLRRTPSSASASSGSEPGSKSRRPQATTLLVNRNGQTVYLAPELLGLQNPYPYAYAPSGAKKQRVPVGGAFPQPPLTVPVRRQGRPTQYITIPWSQLGLSPPEQQSVVSLAEGLQAQPLILNIPQSAISPVRTSGGQKKKRPQLTAAAVPLLADASLMDIFQPPQIPPSRTGSPSSGSSKPISAQPVLIAAKPVKAGAVGAAGLLPTRIRPGTIVEKAPAMEAMDKPLEAAEAKPIQEAEASPVEPAAPQATAANGGAEQQEFILVGDDDEPGVSRHVQPAFGDARFVSYGDFHPYFDLLTQNRRFALRKSGRSLENAEEQAAPKALTTFGKAPQEEAEKEAQPEKEEVKVEEPKKEEPKKEEIKEEEPKNEEIKEEEPKKEEPKKEEPKKEEPKKEEIKEEEPKKEEQ